MNTDVTELTARLIQNRCVNDGTPASGHESRSVDTLSDVVGAPDFVIEPEPGRMSALYRVAGSVPDAPALLLMGHTDVVPVNEQGWSVDPFAGEIRDGFLWGRGAVDMLNLTAAMATVFAAHRSGDRPPLPGDLLFLAVADEEAAGGLGAGLLVDRHWDQVGAPYVLTEIAYPPLVTDAGMRIPVSVAEKGPFWTRLATSGEPGHGSQPYGRSSALEPMAEAIAGLFREPGPVVITDIWRSFVDALGVDPDLASALVDPERVDEALEDLLAISPRLASYAHACTHMTVSPNVVRGGVKANVIADRADAQVDVRALPGHTRVDVDAHLEKAMGRAADRVELLPVADHEANESLVGSNPLWEATQLAVESLVPGADLIPTMMPATTDGRFFRDRGAIAYGVGLFDDLSVSFPDFLAMFHGNDERVSLRALRRTEELLDEVVTAYGRITSTGVAP